MKALHNKVHLGKYDYTGNGRKDCDFTLEIELEFKEREGLLPSLVEIKQALKNPEILQKYRPCFSVCGDVKRRTRYVAGGQCLDDMLPFLKGNSFFTKVHDYWKKYHLNDLTAGTPEQEQAIASAKAEGKLKYPCSDYYKECCDYLSSIGLYEVMLDGEPYKYGHKWLYRPIPNEVLADMLNSFFQVKDR